MDNKQLLQCREQIKKQIVDLDQQIYDIETFYLEDTRQFGNILKGFDNYLSTKTSRNQIIGKKNKIQNQQRLFSLGSIKNKTSELLQESLINEVKIQAVSAPKRPRIRQGGMNKSTGKALIARSDIDDFNSHSQATPQNIYSKQQSAGKGKINQKRKKKIIKSTKPHRKT